MCRPREFAFPEGFAFAGRRHGFDPFGGAFWAGFGGKGAGSHWSGGGWRRGRMFEQGDLKYVVLQLLAEKPRHGYEIIKELEDRFGGAYSPSPGTVYPTLTMLEDLGYAKANTEEGGKKIYEITQEGRDYLAQHKETVDDIFDRIARFGAGFFGEPMMEVNRAFKDLAREIYAHAPRHLGNAEHLKKVAEILRKAAKDVEDAAAAAKESA
jgi:DNA-binding PadR family transcriptional regulator